jgi:predicted nucleotidyltransferase
MLDLKEILDVAKIHPKRAISAYVYGSRIYGTSTDESDWDISLIAKTSVEAIEIKSNEYNIHIYTLDRWVKDLEWHNPKCLECHFAPERRDIVYYIVINNTHLCIMYHNLLN